MGSDSHREWYIPTFIDRWRSRAKGEEADLLTQIVAMNHLEAVVERESVDISYLVSCMSDEEDTTKASEANDLIDKFLALGDYRIVAPNEEESEVEQEWELVDVEFGESAEDDCISEELAQIYLKQGLYAEAKEIYSKLSLQYSEKSVYFAGLKERLEAKISGKVEK